MPLLLKKTLSNKWVNRGLWFAYVAILMISAGLILNIEISTPKPKLITGINLYKHPITIRLNDRRFELDSFDTYSMQLPKEDLLEIEITNDAGEVLAQRKSFLGNQRQVVFDIWSAGEFVEQCFIEANVTSVFYAGTPDHIDSFQVISDKPLHSLRYDTTRNFDLLLLPGTYNGQSLEDTISTSKSVYGIYPVECTALTDIGKIKQDILWWSAYTPQQQRDLYNQELSEIAAITE